MVAGDKHILVVDDEQIVRDGVSTRVAWGDNGFELVGLFENGQMVFRLRDTLGVTRLSLGVENFSDELLEENGRAHLSKQVYNAWEWITSRCVG